MPAAGERVTGRELITRLAAFLTELTSDRSPAAVHADIVEQLSESDHDPRLEGVADVDRFTTMWAELGAGSALPAEAWQAVVLPVVVALSSPNDLKTHLELATNQWMTASSASDSTSQTLVAAGTGALSEPETEPQDRTFLPAVEHDGRPPKQASSVDIVDAEVVPVRPRQPRRALIGAMVVAALIAVSLVWWTQARDLGSEDRLSPPPPLPAGDSLRPATATPATDPQATDPQATPTNAVGGATPTPVSTQPVPAPTWTGPGPIIAPTAPRNLAVVGATDTTIALSWQPPVDAGTGGMAYYRIWREGTDAGWTTQTSATVTGLAPATAYTFTVTAHNAAGAASPPGGPITTSTRPSPPQQPTPQQPPTPQAGPPAANPKLATDPPGRRKELGRSFAVTGSDWPCTTPSIIEIYLGGSLVATPGLSAQGSFRTTITVDASQPDAPTVAVIGSSEPLTLTIGLWSLAAHLPAQPSCSATADQHIEIEFRKGPR